MGRQTNKVGGQGDLKDSVKSIRAYAEDCRSRVKSRGHLFFVPDNFLGLKFRRLAKDFAAQTFNVMYAPFYVLLRDFAFWLEELGINQGKLLLAVLPAHLPTVINSKYECFLAQDIFAANEQKDPVLRSEILESLKCTSTRRAEKTDLNVSAVSVLLGFFFFKKHGFSLTALTQHWSRVFAAWYESSDFFLGEKIGQGFYYLFPPEPSFWQVVLTGVLVVMCFGVLVQVFMLALYALQIRTGLYKNRMLALVDQVEERLIVKTCS